MSSLKKMKKKKLLVPIRKRSMNLYNVITRRRHDFQVFEYNFLFLFLLFRVLYWHDLIQLIRSLLQFNQIMSIIWHMPCTFLPPKKNGVTSSAQTSKSIFFFPLIFWLSGETLLLNSFHVSKTPKHTDEWVSLSIVTQIHKNAITHKTHRHQHVKINN